MDLTSCMFAFNFIRKYDPEDWFFPGQPYLDGTIEGALKACIATYPCSPNSREKIDLSILDKLFSFFR